MITRRELARLKLDAVALMTRMAEQVTYVQSTFEGVYWEIRKLRRPLPKGSTRRRRMTRLLRTMEAALWPNGRPRMS